MKTDQIEIEILPDGTLKLQTDDVSLANHTNAENLVREMSKLCGGPAAIRQKPGKHAHGHGHSHGHGAGQHTHG
jgi:hypothetical protein